MGRTDRSFARLKTMQRAHALAASWPDQPFPTSMGTVELHSYGQGVMMLIDGYESSFIDLLEPTHLEFEYLQHIDAFLHSRLEPDQAFRALHLGAAACSLPRAWAASYPRSSHVAVEVDAILAQNVRQWFDLPSSPVLKIRVGEGGAVMSELREASFDVIVRDAFIEGEIPPSLTTPEFYLHCERVLRPEGVFIANVASGLGLRSTLWRTKEMLASLKNTGLQHVLVLADSAVIRGKRIGNAVVGAARTEWDIAAVERLARKFPLPVRVFQPRDPELRMDL
ncbi:MAG: fused MFS/spermidine synthase [Actinomycetaceae bacterium]|nr:fused MFS/spermidine synthase [Actinomycetaceae bacterium]